MTTSQHTTIEQLIELVEPVCVDAGYELVDIEYTTGQQGWLVRIYIDFPVGSGKSISFGDCERLSHEVSALLDVEDPIDHKYSLEVSSPGIDRPLRKADDFKRFVGQEAKVSLHKGLDGRRNFKGRLVEVRDTENDVIIEVDGITFDLPLADLASAKLVPDWNALMKGAGKQSS